MNSQQVFTLGQEGLLQLLMVSAPVLLTVLVVGLVGTLVALLDRDLEIVKVESFDPGLPQA